MTLLDRIDVLDRIAVNMLDLRVRLMADPRPDNRTNLADVTDCFFWAREARRTLAEFHSHPHSLDYAWDDTGLAVGVASCCCGWKATVSTPHYLGQFASFEEARDYHLDDPDASVWGTTATPLLSGETARDAILEEETGLLSTLGEIW